MTTRPRRLRYDPDNDLYSILSVASNATPAQLQQAFRRRAKVVHPDRNPDKLAWAHEQFQLLNEAYDILTNEQWRAVYDRQRRFYFARHGLLDESDYWPGSQRQSASSAKPGYAPPVRPKPSPSAKHSRSQGPFSDVLIGPYRYIPVLLLGVLVLNIMFIFAVTSSQSFDTRTPTRTITPVVSPTAAVSPTPDIIEIRYLPVSGGSLVLDAIQYKIVSDGTI